MKKKDDEINGSVSQSRDTWLILGGRGYGRVQKRWKANEVPTKVSNHESRVYTVGVPAPSLNVY